MSSEWESMPKECVIAELCHVLWLLAELYHALWSLAKLCYALWSLIEIYKACFDTNQYV